MVARSLRDEEINVLASDADWAWPEALRNIFIPRGINLLVAHHPREFMDVLENRRIHTTIVDADSEIDGLAMIKVIRMGYPRIPCIMLTGHFDETVLGKALQLEVFSVINKPVDMGILQGQLDRLFIKRYGIEIFR